MSKVSVDREHLERWLECAERCESLDGKYSWADVIVTIKEALAQPKQEPVGKLVSDDIEGHVFVPYGSEWPFNVDLYTEPPHHALMAQFYKDEYDQLKEKYKNLYKFRTSPSDGEIRKLWAEYASKIHAWPNNSTPPMCDINGFVGFECDWHESEYQVFKAGFLACQGTKESL